jgi:hypothetical protein
MKWRQAVKNCEQNSARREAAPDEPQEIVQRGLGHYMLFMGSGHLGQIRIADAYDDWLPMGQKSAIDLLGQLAEDEGLGEAHLLVA